MDAHLIPRMKSDSKDIFDGEGDTHLFDSKSLTTSCLECNCPRVYHLQ